MLLRIRKTPSAVAEGVRRAVVGARRGRVASGRAGPRGPLLRPGGGRSGGRHDASAQGARPASGAVKALASSVMPARRASTWPMTTRPAGRSRSASSSPRSSARSAGPSCSTWPARSRTSASTRSGSASTCCTAGADRPPRGPWEAWTLLPASPRSRTRVELGPLVACTNFHNPALLAKQAATIDEISGGRFVLGLGAGWNETEFDAFGYPVRPPDRPLRGGVHDHPDAPARGRDRLRRPLLPGARLRAAAARPAPERTAADDRLDRAADAATSRCPTPTRGTSGTTTRTTARPASPRCATSSTTRAVGAGRDPAAVERTVAVQVRMPGGTGRLAGRRKAHAADRWRARRPRWPRSCGRTPTRGSPTSSWSSIRSPREHRGIRTRPRGALEGLSRAWPVRSYRGTAAKSRASLTAAMRTSNPFAARGHRRGSRSRAAGLIAVGLFVVGLRLRPRRRSCRRRRRPRRRRPRRIPT